MKLGLAGHRWLLQLEPAALQYPYNSSSSDGEIVLIPSWAIDLGEDDPKEIHTQVNYAENLKKRIQDPSASDRLRADVAHEIQFRGGPDNIVIFEYPDEKFVGKSLGRLARDLGTTPVEMAMRLQLEGFPGRPGGARLRGFSLSESDVEAFIARPWVATSTDGDVVVDGKEMVHPRSFGTYPRKIRYYALDKKVISLETAVRSSTSLPAQILGIHDRGKIENGSAADLVVFDLDRIRDTATFIDPLRTPEGIEEVLINGVLVVDGGKSTGNLPGMILKKEIPK